MGTTTSTSPSRAQARGSCIRSSRPLWVCHRQWSAYTPHTAALSATVARTCVTLSNVSRTVASTSERRNASHSSGRAAGSPPKSARLASSYDHAVPG